MAAFDEQNKNQMDGHAGAASKRRSLQDAARAVLEHRLTLPEEDEAAEQLRAMGVEMPTGADAVLLGQYLRALRGDTAAAKYVRDAADLSDSEEQTPVSELDLTQLTDAELQALARQGEDGA